MKGIILAGGRGTRLSPLTNAMSKQLLGVYDKPMIYYPLASLLKIKINEILIISTPEDIKNFERLLGSGKQWGIHLEYAVQDAPRGIAEAFIIGKDFINKKPSCLILGDNIFFEEHKSALMAKNVVEESDIGAVIFGYPVKNPNRYGVVVCDEKSRPLAIEEKPENPKSNLAIPGYYFYDSHVSEYAQSLQPSPRGELEITDINKLYLENNRLGVVELPSSTTWFDAGTHESLLQAAEFISAVQNRQDVMIGCLEEIAYKNKFINKEQLSVLAKQAGNNAYGEHLWKLLKN